MAKWRIPLALAALLLLAAIFRGVFLVAVPIAAGLTLIALAFRKGMPRVWQMVLIVSAIALMAIPVLVVIEFSSGQAAMVVLQ